MIAISGVRGGGTGGTGEVLKREDKAKCSEAEVSSGGARFERAARSSGAVLCARRRGRGLCPARVLCSCTALFAKSHHGDNETDGRGLEGKPWGEQMRRL